jgi:hypothetical protein
LGDAIQIELILMRGNQLPVSAARWQHWSQIFFAFFAKNSTTTKAREKIKIDLEPLEF